MKYKILIVSFFISAISVNAQNIKTYSGNYSGVNTNGKATYTYFDTQNDERVYNGNFKYSAIANNIKIIAVGNLKDNKRMGAWRTSVTLLKPSGTKVGWTEKATMSYKDGKLHGKATYSSVVKDRWSGGIAVSPTNINANFANGLFTGQISSSLKNSGVLTVAINGQFDGDGYMNGKWVIKYHADRSSLNAAKNSAMINDIRYYKHGVLSKDIIKNMSTGKILAETDKSSLTEDFFKNFDKELNLSIVENKTYQLVDITDGSHVGYGYANEHLTDLLTWWNISKEQQTLIYEIPIGAESPRNIVERTIKEIDIISIAKNYAIKSDFNNALKYTKIAISTDSNNFEYKNIYGRYLILNKQFEKAQTVLSNTLNLCKSKDCDENLNIERNLSHAYLLNNNYEKSLEIHKKNLNEMINNHRWIDVIYKDFEYMKSHNINSPNFEHLKKEIKKIAYTELIQKADNNLNSKNYKKAKNKYQEALILNPDEEYPKQKIEFINQLVIAKREYFNICIKINKQVVEVEKAYKNSTAEYTRYLEIFYNELMDKQNYPNQLYDIKMIETNDGHPITTLVNSRTKKLYKKYLKTRDFLQKETQDSNAIIDKYNYSKTLLSLTSKMLELVNSDTKEMQKALKKTENPKEILSIIGVEILVK